MQDNKQQEIKTKTKLEETLDVKKKDNSKKETEEIPLVEGVFKNWEIRGAPITFSFCKDKKTPKKYTLEDGKKYKLPLNVAKHINRCMYPVSKAEVDKHGAYIGKRESMVRRYSFRRVDDLIDDIE